MHRATIMTGVMTLAGILALAGTATAQSPSPSPPPADGSESSGLPAGLVTEEVASGVLRVVSDGHRVLSDEREDGDVLVWGEWQRTHLERKVVTAPDGAVWGFDDTGMFELGKKKTRSLKGEPPVRFTDDVEIAPDDTIWRVGTPKAGLSTLHSFNGKKWRRDYLPGMSVFGVEVRPNGAVWALWAPPVGADPQGLAPRKLGKWNGKRWKVFDLPKVKASYGGQFAVTGNDEVWVCCKDKAWAEQQRLVRFDGRRFKVEQDPAPQSDRFDNDAPLLIDGSSDGTLWMRRTSSVLARHDDDGWTVFTAEDGVPQMGWQPWGGGFLRAAPDGTVWVTTTVDAVMTGGMYDGEPYQSCDGLAHFDGMAWSHHLEGMCVWALDIAPDGVAWVQAANTDTTTTPEPQAGEPVEPVQTYVIDPGAREATTEMPPTSPLPSPSE